MYIKCWVKLICTNPNKKKKKYKKLDEHVINNIKSIKEIIFF